MELSVLPLQRTIPIQSGANLLNVLLENQVPISYSCMSGRCGTCRCKVVSGEVMESGQEPSVTPKRAGNTVLACQTTLLQNCAIEIAEPDEVVVHPAKIVKATVTALENLTHDIKRVRLSLAKPLEFSPGQYATLQFTPEHIRPYSMAGLASDDGLEFHLRLVPGGRVTSFVANQLKVGDAVRVSGPLGTAYLRKKHEDPVICVAGGTGLAPMLSILRGALEAGMRNSTHLYFGVRSPRDVYGLPWLEALARDYPELHVHTVVAAAHKDAKFRSGMVTDAIAQDWKSLAGWRAYLAGAPVMVDAVTMLLKQKGLAENRIYADAFYPTGI